MRQKLLSLRHKKSRVHTRSSRLFQLFRWTRYLNQLHVIDLMLKGHHGHTLTDITDSFFLVKYVQPSKKWPIISRIQVRRREFISSLDIPLEHVLLRTNDRPREIFYLARSDLNIARAISTLWLWNPGIPAEVKVDFLSRKEYDHGWKYTILKLNVLDHFAESSRSLDWKIAGHVRSAQVYDS